jgi:hypothetical protein
MSTRLALRVVVIGADSNGIVEGCGASWKCAGRRQPLFHEMPKRCR